MYVFTVRAVGHEDRDFRLGLGSVYIASYKTFKALKRNGHILLENILKRITVDDVQVVSNLVRHDV